MKSEQAKWAETRKGIENSGDQGVPGQQMKPRHLLRELEKVIMETEDVVLGTDIGNISAVANGYAHFKKP